MRPRTPSSTLGVLAAAGSVLALASRAPFAVERQPVTPQESLAERVQRTSAIVTGTLRLPQSLGGTGARGVAIELSGWSMLPNRSPNTPFVPWTSPSTVTDDDGRFELVFEPPRAHQYTLNVRVDGCVPYSRRWSGLQPGDRVDLGVIALEAAATIHGRIVDASGAPVRERWTVYGDSRRPGGMRADLFIPPAQSATNASTGEFTLDGVPAGPVGLRALPRLGGQLEGPVVEAIAGETVEATLTWTGPDLSRRIIVQLQTPPYWGLANEVAPVRLIAAPRDDAPAQGAEPRKPPEPLLGRREPNQPQRIVFDLLDDGEYTVEVADPRFRTWREEHVEPGTLVDAPLLGAAAVRLSVVDAQTREPVIGYGVRTRIAEPRMAAGTHELVARGNAPDNGLIPGLLAIAQTLIVHAEGYDERELALAAPVNHATPELLVELPRGRTLSGRVVEGDGVTPAAGLEVELRERSMSVPSGWTSWPDMQARFAKTDADGRFAFSGLSSRAYLVEVTRSALVSVRGALPARDAVTSGAKPDAKLDAKPGAKPGATPGVTSGATASAPKTGATSPNEAAKTPAEAAKAAIGAEPSSTLPQAKNGELALALPKLQHVRGTITAGEAVDFSRTALLVTPVARTDELRMRWQTQIEARDRSDAIDVDATGAFEADLPLGPATFELVAFPDPSSSAAVRALRVPLGPVEIGRGEISRGEIGRGEIGRVEIGAQELAANATQLLKLDAGVNAPCGARIDVLVDGAPIAGLSIALHGAGANSPVCEARTDADGSAFLGPLAAGTAGSLVHAVLETTDASGRSWSFCTSEPIELTAGRVSSATIDVSVVSASLEVRADAGDSPFARRTLTITPSASPVPLPPRIVRTDEHGRVSLTLVPGSYRVEELLGVGANGQLLPPTRSGATFEWTSAGAEPASVVLEAR